MRITLNSVTVRVIVILIVGAGLIAADLLFLVQANPGLSDWLAYIVITVIGLLMIAYIISWQLIKPLKQLAAGAKLFSSDINAASIAETGPLEVRETARSFNQMQARIKSYVEERMQLIAAISHDLRTPLTRLQFHVESLDDELQKQKALDDIRAMSAMIQSVLVLFRDESRIESLQNTDMVSLLRSVCDDVSDSTGPATYTGLQLCTLHCRPIAIRRALNNLIENAVRYGSEASVNLSVVAGKVIISIRDQGPGIPESELDKVFVPFYRVDKSRNRNTGGIGLGLGIAQSLIQSHGGRVIAKNDLPNGLHVSVELPNLQQ